jgi:hypothetical protein
MKAGSTRKKPLTFVALAGLCLLLFWIITYDYLGRADDEAGKRPHTRVQRVSSRNGETLVTVTKSAQEKSGIVAAPLESATHAEELQAYGVVLQLTGLSDLRRKYLQAKARVDSETVKLKAAKQEYDRVKALHAIKNVSDKALQAAETDWELQKIGAQTSEEDLGILKSGARQQWGQTLVRWVSEGSPNLQELLQQQAVLIQLTLPPGVHIQPAPPTVLIRLPGRPPVSAHLVSLSPRTDPRIQGESFFYTASPPSQVIILPGMDLTAFMPAGPPVRGVIIPASAIVWRQGKAWAYLQVKPDGFARRQVPTDAPVSKGYFVTKNFRAADRIVVKGAQSLLSEEFLPRAQEADTD